jgi:Excalibur calcium-binding domain
MQNIRNNKNFRIITIVILMLLVLVLYFRNVNTGSLMTADGIKDELGQNVKPDTLEKKVLLGIFGLLGAGLGLEVTNNDIDLGKLIETKSLSASKVMRDSKGNVVTEEEVKAGTKTGKHTDEYNCADFKTQMEAQEFFTNAGGVSGDTNRLDGNKDGEACTSLPKNK